ncbi:UNVERIFIED_CONTAM: hypothetical protein Sangu_0851800 [Sesamum angustifolium]|uniref:TLC domain-containing protein n=1 Tax=Sesamum angustifolium TaxID=2727405 RepID=A0AAW2PC10_9LAMI
MSVYFVFWSDLFADHNSAGPITLRNSPLSTFVLGILHHSLSGIAVAYSMFTGEGQLYTFMVLISEVTTPEINMRWYLDMAGLKKSSAYLINGVMIFFGWLVRISSLPCPSTKVMQMHTVGFLLVFSVPLALAVMNLLWFGRFSRD